MKIRTRLSILFTLITATILLVFAAVIYYSAREDREREFYALLKREGITKARLFFDAKMNAQTLQDIYKSNRKTLDEVEVAVYDTGFRLLYHDALEIDVVKETRDMVDHIYSKGEIRFYQGEWQVVGLRYTFEGRDYIVTAAAYDQYGYSKLNSLLRNIIIVFIASIFFIYIAGRFFSRRAFKPVKAMTKRARQISATNLDLRLAPGSNGDELSEMADTFNNMLDRLENSFDAQKNFVSNISHELRTPLAAIITELELAAGNDGNADKYRSVIRNVLSDSKKLVRLSNSLLDLAKASYDPSEIAFRTVRVDEILLDACQQIGQVHPVYKADIHFESEIENDRQVLVNGNEYLLKVAFYNLFENGCKFSEDHHSRVSVRFGDKKIILNFSDKGIGMPQEDLDKLFTPFFRGTNKSFAEGNGIGLVLTRKIILLHKGNISVTSAKNTGTTFTVELPPSAPLGDRG